jgi:chromosome segregation ATPase
MTMARRTHEPADDVNEQLAEAQARIEALESAAADAEARAATMRTELGADREARSAAEAQLAEAIAARESVEGALSAAQAQADEARTLLAEATVKYREAKLASAPDVPSDLVPAAQSLAEIDEGFEAARRIVGQLRERIEEQRPPRVPVGSPTRRGAPDLSALSASEKIRVGLQELSEREGR